VATRILDELDIFSGRNVWMRLSVIDAQILAEFLSREHPQSAALILSRLSPEHAGRVISLLEPELAQQIVMAVRKIVNLPTTAVDAIADSINRTLFASKVRASAMRPAERLGSIINYASGEIRDSLIAYLETEDPEFAEETKRNMFTFPDIETRIRRQDVSTIVRTVEYQTLIKALAGAEKSAPDAKKYILSNISSRMAEAISQEIKEAGTVRRKDADAAQSEVIKVIRQLEQSGEIALVKDDEE
jgi:flagellar motor switch protein FliG